MQYINLRVLGSIVIHLDLFLNLLEKALPCVLAQVEVVAEFLYDFVGVVVLKNFDFLDVFAVQLYLEHAYWLLNYR